MWVLVSGDKILWISIIFPEALFYRVLDMMMVVIKTHYQKDLIIWKYKSC